MGDIQKNIDNGKIRENWRLDLEYPAAATLIENMIKHEPSNRWTIQECVRHPFFWQAAEKKFLVQMIDHTLYTFNNKESRDFCAWFSNEVCFPRLANSPLRNVFSLLNDYQQSVQGFFRGIRNMHHAIDNDKLKEEIGGTDDHNYALCRQKMLKSILPNCQSFL